jgi:hypothetical protein
MRVKNKEIRARRHRKEQKVKDAQRLIRAEFAGREPAPKAPAKPTAKGSGKSAAKKPAAKKKSESPV